MSVLNENTIIGASAAGGDYEIEQSLRFDDAPGTYLTRTFPSAGNRKTWTYSLWFKRGNLGGGEVNIFTCYTASNDNSTFQVSFNGSDQLNIGAQTVSYGTPTQVFRDTSAWYHLVIALDTTQGTADNRVKVYVNGQQVTSFSAKSNPSQNADLAINQAAEHVIGSSRTYSNMFDGYMGEINFIDGQALTPDSFGETGTYGEWKPIAYAGTYGTNGFYLPFEQDYSVEGFSTVVYEGTGAAQYIGGTGFKPDFVWGKNRGETRDHYLFDAVRGANNYLKSNTTGAAADHTQIQTSFDNDGFTVGTSTALNNNGYDHVAWCWDMGGTTASNTSGSITSSVRANTTYGQSIVSWTGNATNAATVGHGLGAVPEMVIVKNRDRTSNWHVGGDGVGTDNQYLNLNTTSAIDSASTGFQGFTSSVFQLGTDTDWNANNEDMIAYCFHSVTGYSKFGSYSGSGSAGKAITTGFAPAFVMVKRSSGVGSWGMYDNTRNQSNSVTSALFANLSDAESVETSVEFTSTSFIVNATGTAMNGSGDTYIYMAFADTREYAYWYDQSGNNNDWTSEGGLTESDVMVDSPTNNFATASAIASVQAANPSYTVFSEGNLKIGNAQAVVAGYKVPFRLSGKVYFECNIITLSYQIVGIAGWSWDGSYALPSGVAGLNVYPNSGGELYSYNAGGSETNSSANAYTIAAGGIIGIAYDEDSGKAWFSIDGVWHGSGNPATGANPVVTFNADKRGDIYPAGNNYEADQVLNFGQDSSFAGNKTPQGNQDANGIGDFYYAPPTGFLALCTANLPSVDVIPSENFNTIIWSGAGNASRNFTGVGFQPDFVWARNRTGVANHLLYDSIRTAGANKNLISNTTDVEGGSNPDSYDYLSSFNTDGFSSTWSGSNSTYYFNQSSYNYVAWNWKAGGSAVSNTNGTITSSVSANVDAGFSILTYTGTGAIAATIGHGLSSAPEMIIRKDRDAATNWVAYHASMGTGNGNLALFLNTTSAQDGGQGFMNNTAPTSTVFTQGDQGFVGVNGNDYIAYCFHSVEGYSKVGSYTGNGSADGPFVHCGFRPAWVMIKRTDAAGDSWGIHDATRGTYNVSGPELYANTSEVEGAATRLDFTSNGFKQRSTGGLMNASGGTFIFLAFAESPFKHSNAR
jgi:hypothetical protein